jgi:hypothetical protein
VQKSRNQTELAPEIVTVKIFRADHCPGFPVYSELRALLWLPAISCVSGERDGFVAWRWHAEANAFPTRRLLFHASQQFIRG